MMELERIPLPPVPEGAVLCRSTGHGAGCGHPVDWHTGPGTVAPDCDCCSWRKNDPEVLVQGPARTPPPAGFPVEKWASMSRRERRAARKGGRR